MDAAHTATNRSVGKTPVQIKRADWERAGGLEVRLPGHESVAADAPADGLDCNRTFVLRALP